MKQFRITVEKAAFGGSFIGFHDGKAVFTTGVLPGEEVIVEPLSDKGDYLTCKTVDLIKTSPHRITPPCPAWPQCGGCSYLHTDYETELELKKNILIDSLRRTGGIRGHIPDIKSGERFHYRSHATVKSSHETFGFFAEGSNRLIPLPDKGCLLPDRAINDAISLEIPSNDEVRFAVDGAGAVHTSKNPEDILLEREGSLRFHRKIWNFYQANRFLRSEMLNLAEEYAGLKKDETFLDIGCGVGFFTLHLAQNGNRGTGIDIERSSIELARKNARLNTIDTVTFKKLDASRLHPQGDSADVVLADPPRAGLDKKTRKTILAIAPKRIVYVSCNPATFARDLAEFRKGGYEIQRLSLLDMFPATRHLEAAALLSR